VIEVADLKGWQLRYAIDRAVNGKGTARLEEALREVLQAAQRADYPISQSDVDMLMNYIGDKLKRPAHRPKSTGPEALAKSNQVLWMAVNYVERYKRVQRDRYGRVKGVEPEAIDKAIAFVAKRYGGAPADADEAAIDRAIAAISEKVVYKLTANRIADRLHRGRRHPKKRN
jgi:hypothetical protein